MAGEETRGAVIVGTALLHDPKGLVRAAAAEVPLPSDFATFEKYKASKGDTSKGLQAFCLKISQPKARIWP